MTIPHQVAGGPEAGCDLPRIGMHNCDLFRVSIRVEQMRSNAFPT